MGASVLRASQCSCRLFLCPALPRLGSRWSCAATFFLTALLHRRACRCQCHTFVGVQVVFPTGTPAPPSSQRQKAVRLSSSVLEALDPCDTCSNHVSRFFCSANSSRFSLTGVHQVSSLVRFTSNKKLHSDAATHCIRSFVVGRNFNVLCFFRP